MRKFLQSSSQSLLDNTIISFLRFFLEVIIFVSEVLPSLVAPAEVPTSFEELYILEKHIHLGWKENQGEKCIITNSIFHDDDFTLHIEKPRSNTWTHPFFWKNIYNIFHRLFEKPRGKPIQCTCFESQQPQFMFLSH